MPTCQIQALQLGGQMGTHTPTPDPQTFSHTVDEISLHSTNTKSRAKVVVIQSPKVPAVLAGQALPQKYRRVAGRFAIL